MPVNELTSKAIEGGASVEDVNNILSRGGQDTLKVTQATPINRDIPVGADLFVDLSGDSDEFIDITATTSRRTESESLRDRQIGEAAIIASDIEGTNVAEEARRIEEQSRLTSSSNELMQQAIRQLSAEQELIRELGNEKVVASPEEGLDLAVATNDMINEEEAKKNRVDAPAVALVNSLSAPFTSPDSRKREEVMLTLGKVLTDLNEDISTGERIGDALLDIIPLKFLHDNWQSVNGETLNPFAQEERWRNQITQWKRLPPEEQEAAFNVIKDELLEVLPRSRVESILTAMVNPLVDEEQMLNDFGVFGTVDTALTLLPVIGWIGRGILRARNAVKVADAVGNSQRASELNMAVLADESGEAAKKLDMPQDVAVENALPFHSSDFAPGATDGLAPDIQKRIQEFKESQDAATSNIIEGESFIREGFLDEVDVDTVVEGIQKKFDDQINSVLSKQGLIADVQHVSSDASGAEFKFVVKDQAGEIIQEAEFTHKFKLNEVGEYEVPRAGWLANWFKSPKFKFGGSDTVSAVNAAARLDASSQRVANQLLQIMPDIRNTLKKDGRNVSKKELAQEVDMILLHGDDLGVEFDVSELRAGVNGIKLNDSQIEAYFKARMAFNRLGDIQEAGLRRIAELRNVKMVNLPEAVGDVKIRPGEVRDTASAAQGLLPRNVTKIYDARTNTVQRASKLDWESVYAGGGKLVKLEEVSEIGELGKFTHVIAKVDDIEQLPIGGALMTRRTGYVPRVNKNAFHFVKRFSDDVVDGALTKSSSTVRVFDNKKDADLFATALTESNETPGVSFRALTDRELEQVSPGSTGLTPRGGLFYGPRKEEALEFGLPDEDLGTVAREGAFDSLILYSENLKNFSTRAEWRIGAEIKWENTANKLLPEFDGELRFNTFQAKRQSNNPNLNFLIDMKEAIETWSGFSSKGDQWWSGFTQRAFESALGAGIKRERVEFLTKWAKNDPVALAKASAFHLLLGAFNPIQAIVQAQGAAVSFGVMLNRPINAFNNLLRKQIGLNYLQHVDDVNNPIFDVVTRAAGYKPDEARKVKQLLDKSGLIEAMFTNADIEAARRGVTLGTGAVRRVADKGLMFYRAGEGFNRRMAFLAALDEVDDINRLLTDNNAFRKVMSRTNDLLLNLGKANRAGFQEGLPSVPTQFMQVIAKTNEQILSGLFKRNTKSSFTFGERWRIFATQVALYGAAGLPAGAYAFRYMMDVAGATQEDINNPDNRGAVEFLNGGLSDLLAYQMGFDLDVGNRLSLVQGFNDLVLGLVTETTTPLELAFGASAQGPLSVFKAFDRLKPFFTTGLDLMLENPGDPEDIAEAVKFMALPALELAGSPFSTWRNSTKALYMSQLDKVINSRGGAVTVRDFKLREEIAVAVGFRTGDEARLRDITKMNTERAQAVDDYANLKLHMWNRWVLQLEALRNAGTENPIEQEELFMKAMRSINAGLEDPKMAEEVQAAFQRKLQNQVAGRDKLSRATQKALETISNDLADEFIGLNNRLIPLSE